MLSRRSFVRGILGFATLALTGCGKSSNEEPPETAVAEETPEASEAPDEEQGMAPEPNEPQVEEVEGMRIQVVVNGVAFTATLDAGAAGRELLSRLPLTLTMEELHGNEKYCYTGESFDGGSYVPTTIQEGDLMVFGSDCLVLFYQTFANDGWGYQRVGHIDDPAGLVDACGSGTATVEFAALG